MDVRLLRHESWKNRTQAVSFVVQVAKVELKRNVQRERIAYIQKVFSYVAQTNRLLSNQMHSTLQVPSTCVCGPSSSRYHYTLSTMWLLSQPVASGFTCRHLCLCWWPRDLHNLLLKKAAPLPFLSRVFLVWFDCDTFSSRAATFLPDQVRKKPPGHRVCRGVDKRQQQLFFQKVEDLSSGSTFC